MKPVVTVFSAKWCGPCKVFKPTITGIHKENADAFTLDIIDIDENPDIATKHGVRGIPTIMTTNNGEVKTSTGAMTKGALKLFLNESGIPC